MRKWVAVLVIFTFALAVWLLSSKFGAPPPAAPKTIQAQNSAVANTLARQNTNTLAIIESNFARVKPAPGTLSSATAVISPAPAGPPSSPQFTNFAPAGVLENMGRAIRLYGEVFGGDCVGNNPEITSQLNGRNPKQINFIKPEDGMRINENGELVDPWGTPYFFHQLSGTVMEIRSAGPDRIMWTSDDLISR